MSIFTTMSKPFEKERNNLLQTSLRDFDTPYHIKREYPFALDENFYQHSFLLLSQDKSRILCHLNLLPKKITHQNFPASQLKIGLIGNVATHPEERGKGYSKILMQKTEDFAHKRDLCALFLWSDLKEFYHKFGFSPCGCEYRFYFDRQIFSTLGTNVNDKYIKWIDANKLDSNLITRINQLRTPPVISISRSEQEFKTLLNIPDTTLLIDFDGSQLNGYIILGKGCDMINVVHEFAFRSEQSFLNLMNFVFRQTKWQQIILLAHSEISLLNFKILKKYSQYQEKHAMSLGKNLQNKNLDLMDSIYIYGLDAI